MAYPTVEAQTVFEMDMVGGATVAIAQIDILLAS